MRVACFQRHAVFDDPAEATARICADLAWAARHDVDMAIYPESYLQGHSYDREIIARRAISLDGASMTALLEELAPFPTTLVLGLFTDHGGNIRNAAAVIRHGIVLGSYAKAFPREEGCVPGTDHPVWVHEGWRFGIAICNDNNHPAAFAPLVAQDARLVCAPLNNMLRPLKADAWRRRTPAVLRGRAQQSGCWIASADVTGPGRDGWMSHGCTMIIRPDGSIASCVAEGEEGVALFDLPAP